MLTCCDIESLLLELSATDGASDLIVTVGQPPQLRVHNEVVALDHPSLTAEDTEQYCLALMSEEQIKRFREEKEIDIAMSKSGLGRYRVNIYQQRGTMAMVVRVVSSKIPTFDELHLPPVVRDLARITRGLVLLTGTTGSGKTSTVASLVDHINRTRRCHIVCIEDPIEFLHSHQLASVSQREVGGDTASFGEALRRVLRQSPDVIVVGEMRDKESAQAAITLAETGHLILGTLHTRGAAESINRLIDLFPGEQGQQIQAQLSASLAAVVWQELLPRKDKDGLMLACEVAIATLAVRALIRQGKTHEMHSVMQAGRKYGMCTMAQYVEDLVQRGLVDGDCLAELSIA